MTRPTSAMLKMNKGNTHSYKEDADWVCVMRGINYYQSKDHEERRSRPEGRRPTTQLDQWGEPPRQANPQRENATENNRANMSGPTGQNMGPSRRQRRRKHETNGLPGLQVNRDT